MFGFTAVNASHIQFAGGGQVGEATSLLLSERTDRHIAFERKRGGSYAEHK